MKGILDAVSPAPPPFDDAKWKTGKGGFGGPISIFDDGHTVFGAFSKG